MTAFTSVRKDIAEQCLVTRSIISTPQIIVLGNIGFIFPQTFYKRAKNSWVGDYLHLYEVSSCLHKLGASFLSQENAFAVDMQASVWGGLCPAMQWCGCNAESRGVKKEEVGWSGDGVLANDCAKLFALEVRQMYWAMIHGIILATTSYVANQVFVIRW